MPNTDSPALQNALAFAARGFRVLAIKPQNKVPDGRFCPEGFKSATLDPPTIKEWFAAEPALNYGVATGNLVAVDIDPRNGGDWRKLLSPTCADVHTWQVATGGGGEHRLFFAPKAVPSGKLAAGIDLKGAGGYIVGPGSLHPSGKLYRWHAAANPKNAELAPLPDWIVEKLEKPKEWNGERRPPEFYNALVGEVFEGERNQRIAALFGHLFGSMFPDRGVLYVLVFAWNRVYCHPPLEEDELRRIALSISAHEDKKRGA